MGIFNDISVSVLKITTALICLSACFRMLSFEGDPRRMLINLCSKKTVDYGYFCRRDLNLNLDLLTEIRKTGGI